MASPDFDDLADLQRPQRRASHAKPAGDLGMQIGGGAVAIAARPEQRRPSVSKPTPSGPRRSLARSATADPSASTSSVAGSTGARGGSAQTAAAGKGPRRSVTMDPGSARAARRSTTKRRSDAKRRSTAKSKESSHETGTNGGSSETNGHGGAGGAGGEGGSTPEASPSPKTEDATSPVVLRLRRDLSFKPGSSGAEGPALSNIDGSTRSIGSVMSAPVGGKGGVGTPTSPGSPGELGSRSLAMSDLGKASSPKESGRRRRSGARRRSGTPNSAGGRFARAQALKKWSASKTVFTNAAQRLALVSKAKSMRRLHVEGAYQVGTRQTSMIKDAPAKCGVTVGTNVWTARRDGTIIVRDYETAGVVATIETHALIWCLCRVGKKVWAGTETGPILVYDIEKRKLVEEARQHAGGVYSIVTDGNGHVWSGSVDFSVLEWDARTRSFVRAFRGHSNGVRCLLVVGQKYLWTGCDDRKVRVFDIKSSDCLKELEGHTETVMALATATTQHKEGSSGAGGPVVELPAGVEGIKDELRDSLADVMQGHNISSLVSTVWSCGTDNSICAWHASAPFELIRRVEVGTPFVCMQPMGLDMWASGQDSSIKVFDTRTMELKQTLEGHSGYIGTLIRVKKRESHIVWSSSMQDNSIIAWRRDELLDWEPAELLSALGAANAALKAALNSIHRDEMRDDAQVAQIKELTEERDSLRETVEALQKKRSGTSQAVEMLKQRLAAVGKARDEEKRLHDAAEARASKVVAKLRTAEAALEATVAEHAGQDAAVKGMESQLQVYRDHVQELEDKVAELEDRVAANAEHMSLVDSLELEKRQRGERIAALEEELAKEKAAHAATSEDLRKECELSLELEAHIREVDVDNMASTMETHAIAHEDALTMIDDLTDKLNVATENERKLKAAVDELNHHVLDTIARRLKGLEQMVTETRDELREFDDSSFTLTEHKNLIGKLMSTTTGRLRDIRGTIAEIAAECLSETQKMHIGTPIAPGRS